MEIQIQSQIIPLGRDAEAQMVLVLDGCQRTRYALTALTLCSSRAYISNATVFIGTMISPKYHWTSQTIESPFARSVSRLPMSSLG